MNRNINNFSLEPPRIEIHQAWWGMIGVGTDGKEWSEEEKVRAITEAGFTGVLGTTAELENEHWIHLIREAGLSWGVGLGPWDGDLLISRMEQAKELGALYANIQPGDAFTIGSEAVEFFEHTMSEAKRIGIPCLFETHRGRMTQDLLRTVDYVRALPAMRLTIDLSHYVLAGEMFIGTGEHIDSDRRVDTYFDTLLQRCSCIHMRVSNAQQIQVDISSDTQSKLLVEKYVGWWKRAISYWYQDAKPGDILPLVSELGPANYAITQTDADSRMEISDRWQQSLVLKQIADSLIT